MARLRKMDRTYLRNEKHLFYCLLISECLNSTQICHALNKPKAWPFSVQLLYIKALEPIYSGMTVS